MAGKPLSAKEKVFVARYAVHSNATKAAREAKYAESTAVGKAPAWVGKSRAKSTKPHVYDAIQIELAKVVRRARKTKDDIIEELENLGFSNMLDFYKQDEDGKLVLDLDNMTREQASALSQMVIDGDKTTIKLVDKKSSLELLGGELGMFKKKHEVSGPDGEPIEVSEGLELARRVAFMLTKAQKETEK